MNAIVAIAYWRLALVEFTEKNDWRKHAAWASLVCGVICLLLTIASVIYIDVMQKQPYDYWESIYFLVGTPIALLGIISGVLGRDTPRAAGLVLSISVLLRLIGGAFAR